MFQDLTAGKLNLINYIITIVSLNLTSTLHFFFFLFFLQYRSDFPGL